MSVLSVGVNVVLADHDWILQRCADELARRLDYVTVSDRPDPAAGLHYYLNYSTRRRPMDGVEVAYFTHVEQDDGARDHFFAVAAAVDHCVCHAERYAEELRERGITDVSVISPGVDLDLFRPVLKVGVVGRTYDSGRKGEALVDAVRDVAGIEWHFTGIGWPEPARTIPDAAMPAFYNDMDVILVPALYEGGPMSVLEALACGTPVIAPDVGWVREFPHRRFKAGDAQDLRRVLEAAVAEKSAGREDLLGRSWDAWVTGHDRLFRKLLADRDLAPARQEPPLPGSVALVLHGGEQAAGGGPSVRVPRTAAALEALGATAASAVFPDPALDRAGLVHGFNLWHPDSALALARYAIARDKPFVFSPIYLDQREHRWWRTLIPDALRAARSPEEAAELLAAARLAFERGVGDGAVQAMPGYDAAARALVALADSVIFLSEHERTLLEGIGARAAQGQVVRNPVDADRFADADPGAFRRMLGVDDYVLCVGRLEPRKNQAMLLQALEDTDLPVVLLGAASDRGYTRILEGMAGGNVHFAGRIAPDDPMLASAYAGARVVVQPSWAEGAPLVALEAAAAGARLVLSNRSSEREYFGDLARYCDPSDLQDLRAAVLDAFDRAHEEGERTELQQFVRERHTYARHARETLAVYQSAWAAHRPRPVLTPQAGPHPAPVVCDVTDLVGRSGANLTTRPVREMAEALLAADGSTRLIAWHPAGRRFVAVDPVLPERALRDLLTLASLADLAPGDLPSGARLLVTGDTWRRDPRYVSDLLALTAAHGLQLTSYLHDVRGLGEQSDTVARRALDTLLAASAHVAVPYAAVAAEVARHAAERGDVPIPTTIARPGDRFVAAAPAPPAELAPPPPDMFTLAIAIDGIGDDERLLARLWRQVARDAANAPVLVIATPAQWREVDAAAATLRASGVVVRTGVSDAELDALLAAATIVVAPPGPGHAAPQLLTEAVARGKIAIGPLTPATEAAVGAAADLIDPLDLVRWSARLTYYLRSRAARAAGTARTGAATSTRWAGTAQALLAATAAAVAPRAGYVVGLKTQLTDTPGDVRKRAGWHPAERWGSWSADRAAAFDFVLAEPARGPLTLCLELRSPLTAEESNACEVVANGHAIGRVVLHGPGWRFFTLPVPAVAITGAAIVAVEIRGTHVAELAAVFAGEPVGRLGGFAVAAVALVDPAFPANLTDYPTYRESLRGAVRLGEDLDLNRDPRAPGFLPERSVIRSDWGARHVGHPPRLIVNPLEYGSEAFDLTLRYRAVASAAAPVEVTIVTREGVLLGTITAADDAIHETALRIPANAHVRPLLIEFVGTSPHPPRMLGLGDTSDAFGIGFFGLRIDAVDASPSRRPAEPYAVGSLLAFGAYARDPRARSVTPFLAMPTWHEREAAGTWTQDGGGQVVLRLDPRPAGPLQLRIEASCTSDRAGPVTAEIRVGGITVHREPRLDDQPFTMEFPLDPALVEPDGTVVITLDTDRPIVPSRAGASLDDRRLGLFVRSLLISEGADLPPGDVA